MRMNYPANEFKRDFPIFMRTVQGEPLVYLDNAATTQKPLSVIQRISDFYSYQNASIYRGVYFLAEEATAAYEASREAVRTFLNASSCREIIFTSGATAGINGVARGWASLHMQQGDEIVLTELEHHANLIVWQHIAQMQGLLLKFIPVDHTGNIVLDRLDDIVTAKTKLIAFSNVSNAIGTQVPITPIINAAHAVGARVLIDASQAVPHMPLDVQALGCDFLVFSGHKMLGPTGVGVTYISQGVLDEVSPYLYGGGMVLEADYTRATWLQPPHKFEAGTPPIAQAIGLHAAIEYLQHRAQFADLQAYEAGLCRQFIEGLQPINGFRILGPQEELGGYGHLVSFVHDQVHAHDLAAYLDQFGICVRAGHYCAQPLAKKLGIASSVRVSFYLYNTPEDVAFLIEKLRAL